MPVAEYDPLAVAVVDLDVVNGAAVGVAVNDAPYIVLAEKFRDRPVVDVHDVGLVRAGMPLAEPACQAGQHAAPPDRAGKDAVLPGRIAGFLPEPLIRDVIGTQDIAVEKDDGPVVRFQAFGLDQIVHARPAAVVVAEQEIAIAADEVDRGAGVGEAFEVFGDFKAQSPGRIVADPGLEQITENIQGARVGGRPGQKIPEQPDGFGPSGVQVKVGDQVDGCSGNQGNSTRSRMTGSTGTSWCIPFVVVSTDLISSTTCMPSTTRPKTA